MTSIAGISSHVSELLVEQNTLVKVLQWRASHQGDRRVFTFLTDGENDEEHMTYGALDYEARIIATRLQMLGAVGERALLLYLPGFDYIAGFFGCLYAGVTAVPAYPPDPTRLNRTLPRLRAMAADSQAAFVLTTSPILAMAQTLFEQAPDLQTLRWLTTDDILEEAADWQEPDITPDSLAFLQYTSGSTGAPKGVMLSHANLLHNSKLITQAFAVKPEDVVVIWLPPYHDMGLIGGILQPIYSGFHCILMSPISFLQRPYRWLQAISNYRATISGGPNFAYELCLRKVTREQRDRLDLSHWRVAFNGAEPVRRETLERFAQGFANNGFQEQAFYPCYGLAEATLIVSGRRKRNGAVILSVNKDALAQNQVAEIKGAGNTRETSDLIGCGQKLLDQAIVIAHPQTFVELGPDQIGEVWVSGASIAQGYWRRPEETAQTFQANLADSGAGPFLRTGDLGFIHEGELFITGRSKDLIIIRGRNHYPQDIELTAEQCHPALRRGCGAAFSIDVGREERLVIVQEINSSQSFVADEVIQAIRQTVAHVHEIQAYAVILIQPRTIPKTSSGKIQRHACREQYLSKTLSVIEANVLENVVGERADGRFAPVPILVKAFQAMAPEDRQNLLASHLLEQAAQILQLSPAQLDPHLTLPGLGLDSVMAVELVYEIESTLGIPLRMEILLQDITISQLAAQLLIDLTTPVAVEAAVPLSLSEQTEHPLSHGQRALWFMNQLDPENPAYNVVHAVRIRAKLDTAALRHAFQELTDRHPMLRTTFPAPQGEPIQVIHPQMEVCFEMEDATTWDDAAVNGRLAAEVYHPFDLEHGPLMRVILFIRSTEEHILLLSMHHIITDLWSVAIIMHEVSQLYKAAATNSSVSLKPLSMQYVDYVYSQNELLAGPEGDRLQAYWIEQLRDAPSALNMPTDRPRTAVPTFHGACESIRLNSQLTQQLKTLARERHATLFMTLLTAFQVLLHRYTGQDDILVGSPKANRRRRSARLIGYFVNPVVIRTNLADDPIFSDLLNQVRQTTLAAFEHSDYPFPLLVEKLQPVRDAGQSPLFQVMFAWQKTTRLVNGHEITSFALSEAGKSMELGGLPLESMALDQWVSPFDLTLMMAEAGAELVATFEYSTDLFDKTTIQRLLAHFQTLLMGIVANPHRRLTQLPIITEQEQQQILQTWNGRAHPLRQPFVHQIIAQQAELLPAAIAVSLGDDSLTYAQLNQRANQLARYLQKTGIERDSRVGIYAERSIDVIVGLLAILKAGGVYLPLDPAMPPERLAFMLEDADAKLVLSQTSLAAGLATYERPVVYLDADWPTITQESILDPVVETTPDSLAYLIYTSGSTGQPKGVLISHGVIADHCHTIRDHFELTAVDHVLQFASFSFDQSIEQILSTLTAGARLVMRGPDIWSPSQFPNLVAEKELSVINLPPAYWDQVTHAWSKTPIAAEQLRLVIIGGDVVNPKTIALWQQLPVGSARLLNAYGPTETTITATTFEIPSPDKAATLDRVPIGRPLSNRTAVILDKYGQPAPIGIPGELHIGGNCLASGYLNQPELTAQRFISTAAVPDMPQPETQNVKMYKTGDLCRYLPDGNIDFLGRVDHQVKVRGFRIELGEIEATLSQHPDVRQTAVLVHDNQQMAGDKRLVAYLAPTSIERKPSTGALQRFLKTRLPKYMIPAQFIIMDALPLSLSGKINRRALPIPTQLRPQLENAYVAPRTSIEQELAQIWSDLLGMEQTDQPSPVGIYDNFFDLGGHSLLATQMASRLRDNFQVEIPLRDLFTATTVADQSLLLAQYQAKQIDDIDLDDLLTELENLSDEETRELLFRES